MFLIIDENMSTKEMKKEMDAILKPIILFCKKWDTQIQYENEAIVVAEVTERIHELMALLKQHDDEILQIRIEKLQQFELNLDLFVRSVNRLKEVETVLVYYLLENQTQTELAENEDILEMLKVDRISQATINGIYKGACLNLIELVKYNQLKSGAYYRR